MGEEERTFIAETTIEKPIQEEQTEKELRKFYKETYKKTYLEERKKYLENKAIEKAKKDATRTPMDTIKEMLFFWRKE